MIETFSSNATLSWRVQVYPFPWIEDVLTNSAQRMHMFHPPMLRMGRYFLNLEYLFAKRAFDIMVSGIDLVIFSPIMVVALCICSKGGPALYKQCHPTNSGKRFNILKFRSMRVDAEKDGDARLELLSRTRNACQRLPFVSRPRATSQATQKRTENTTRPITSSRRL